METVGGGEGRKAGGGGVGDGEHWRRRWKRRERQV